MPTLFGLAKVESSLGNMVNARSKGTLLVLGLLVALGVFQTTDRARGTFKKASSTRCLGLATHKGVGSVCLECEPRVWWLACAQQTLAWMSVTAGVPLPFATDASTASPHGHMPFIRGAVLTTVGFILYVTAVAAVLTHVISSTVASDAVETAEATVSASYRQVEPMSATAVVVGITVADAYCEGHCEGSFDILCTSRKDRIAADWILVTVAEFGQVYRDLGCEPRAE